MLGSGGQTRGRYNDQADCLRSRCPPAGWQRLHRAGTEHSAEPATTAERLPDRAIRPERSVQPEQPIQSERPVRAKQPDGAKRPEQPGRQRIKKAKAAEA